MALYHVHADVIKKGQSKGGATGFAQYIAREQTDKATQFARYIGRDGAVPDDLVAKGHGALPGWAKDPAHFFLMADRYERSGPKRPGTVARTYEIALPRELSPDQRLELAADMRATFFEQYPHAWAIHNPIDDSGAEHPHMHLMLNERRQMDAVQRGPQQYFARAATARQDPATHGVRKDTAFHGPERLQELRAGIAMLTNAALERAGVDAAVSHESLRSRRLHREPAVYTRAGEKAAVEARREDLHRYDHRYETIENVVMWRFWREQWQITDISREAMVDRVRDRFWLQDESPVREQERRESIERSIAREHARTGRPLQGPRTPERTPAHIYGRDLLQEARELLDRMERLTEGQEQGHGAALNVRLWDRERDQGMGF
jgi:hypothetical protein